MGAMNSCDLALLLISDAFLASDFIQSVEMAHLLARRDREKACEGGALRVVPIIVRPCQWRLDVDTISTTQALPTDGKPIVTFPEENGARDQAWSDISGKIASWARAHQGAQAGAQVGVLAGSGAPAPAGTHTRAAAPINPFNPWQSSLPQHFFGRDDALRTLASALETGRSVSLVGDWRIGKTALLVNWQAQAKAMGRVVRLLSGDRLEVGSCGAFVREITGQAVPMGSDNADQCANLLTAWADSVAPQGLPPVILLDKADTVLRTLPYRFLNACAS